jgi:hypothetical protein
MGMLRSAEIAKSPKIPVSSRRTLDAHKPVPILQNAKVASKRRTESVPTIRQVLPSWNDHV